MSARVSIIGAGVAGLAAAWSARRLGHEVTLVSFGPGASALGSGAVDDVPWEEVARAVRTLGDGGHAARLGAELAAFVEDLRLWEVPEAALVLLATVAGRLRPARGRDRALLDLAPLAGQAVLVPRAARAGWDADALAAGLSADPAARARRITFRAVDADVLRFAEESRIADGDLAARHDDEARLGWLATQLRAALAASPGASAVLLGPWLGALSPRAEPLSRAVGARVGEALAGLGSAAGMRFEAARDALAAGLDVRRVRRRAEAVRRAERGFVVSAGGESFAADAVVLAMGGMAGGGVLYAPPEHAAGADLPPGGRVPFALSLRAPVDLSLGGAARMEVVGSLHGPELDAIAWPRAGRPGALETVGVRCEGVRAGEGILAAGDVIAGRPRTALVAAASGIAAGAAIA
jgi:glycerol-3-phosphate dehydrogenase subunit B